MFRQYAYMYVQREVRKGHITDGPVHQGAKEDLHGPHCHILNVESEEPETT